MAGLFQSSIGLLRSRLSRRIVGWVFLSIIAIEAVIFVPSYYRRQEDLLRGLEERSGELLLALKATAMGVGATTGSDPALLEALTILSTSDIIKGVALYRADGSLINALGNPPTASPLVVEGHRETLRQLSNSGTYYDVIWPSQWFEGKYILAVRHNATAIRQELRQYALNIVGLVIIISAFVTFVTILVLERVLIVPILAMRDDLRRAGEAVGRDQFPDFVTPSVHRDDELGEVAQAFQEMYQRVWQEISDRRQAEQSLKVEQEKAERLLLNVLPPAIAAQLKEHSGAIASRFEAATILFADIVDFTGLAAEMSPSQLVKLLNEIFSAFDEIADRLNLEKIKTIGDAYMVVGGVPEPCPNHAESVVTMALEMQQVVKKFRRQDGSPFRLRIGIHTGPVVAGVIGIRKFSYDLWGDTVNIASRFESHGLVDEIQISATTYELVKGRYPCRDRGCITLKGRGEMRAYLLEATDPNPPPYCMTGNGLPARTLGELVTLDGEATAIAPPLESVESVP